MICYESDNLKICCVDQNFWGLSVSVCRVFKPDIDSLNTSPRYSSTIRNLKGNVN